MLETYNQSQSQKANSSHKSRAKKKVVEKVFEKKEPEKSQTTMEQQIPVVSVSTEFLIEPMLFYTI